MGNKRTKRYNPSSCISLKRKKHLRSSTNKLCVEERVEAKKLVLAAKVQSEVNKKALDDALALNQKQFANLREFKDLISPSRGPLLGRGERFRGNISALKNKKRKASHISSVQPSVSQCKNTVCRSVETENEDERVNVDRNALDFDTLDLIDCNEDVVISSSNQRMPQGDVAVLAGDAEDDLAELAEPFIGIEYSRWKNRQRKQGKGKQADVFFRWYIVCETEKFGRGGVQGVAKVLTELDEASNLSGTTKSSYHSNWEKVIYRWRAEFKNKEFTIDPRSKEAKSVTRLSNTAGPTATYKELEVQLAEWIREKRKNKIKVAFRAWSMWRYLG